MKLDTIEPATRVAPTPPSQRFDASAGTALQAVSIHDGPVLLDLDETLYLRSSTEDFIDTARPALIACGLLKLLDLLRPWRWTGPETRDVFRVRLILLCFPWTALVWRRRVKALSDDFANAPLLQAVRTMRGTPVVATLGFLPVVRPLLRAMGLAQVNVVATRVWTMADRRDGKLARLDATLGRDVIEQSLCLTDSVQDMRLLEVCARPLRTVWPGARYRPAFTGLYLPGLYLTRIKRPGARYIRRSILQDDFALWVLASVWLAPFPILHVMGLLGLLVSFWAVYELGYVDNDRIGARFEACPQLSAAFGRVEVATPLLAPWAWAAVTGALGLAACRWPGPVRLSDAILWGGVLVATVLLFRLFNRLDKATRIWPYAGLQLARCAAFAAVVPVVPIAPAALGALVIEKWIPYLVYRLRGGGWELPLPLLRLHLFAGLAVLIALERGAGVLVSWPTLTLTGFMVFKARHDLRRVLSAATRIDRAAPPAPQGTRP
ncbi:hypothetical protein SAMN05444339_101828 [Loktanella atrilutea]|uniref:Uncharacterized protein n=1 Tax=Loktanella atrilutea TaxID=366533 RepID=A0A1M4URN2_LOKAT|nr:haloacid dehalogenase-like hydrolase [Loktanella atrilutea]SHE59354.1 hypothetical protein SAMN05444339_101828 [Loktanella atrilutea]